MLDLFARRPLNTDHIATIKAWTRERFNLYEEVSITVAELRCQEAGCAPIETVIALLGLPSGVIQYKIFKSVAEVQREDVFSAAEFTPAQSPHGGTTQ
jgi:hypothetical protein